MRDFQQCINVEASTKEGAILGKYCLGYLVVKNTSSPFHRKVPSFYHYALYLTVIFQMCEIISLDKFRIEQTMLPGKPQWALCLPDGCTTDDANLVGNFLLTNVIGNEVRVRFSDLLCQTVKEVNPPLTNGAIVTMYVAYYQILAFLSIFFQSYFSFVIIYSCTGDSI
jgi:hypothetical protein